MNPARKAAILRTLKRAKRYGMSFADALQGTGIPLSTARRIYAERKVEQPKKPTK